MMQKLFLHKRSVRRLFAVATFCLSVAAMSCVFASTAMSASAPSPAMQAAFQKVFQAVANDIHRCLDQRGIPFPLPPRQSLTQEQWETASSCFKQHGIDLSSPVQSPMPENVRKRLESVRVCATKKGVEIPLDVPPGQAPKPLTEEEQAIVKSCAEANGGG